LKFAGDENPVANRKLTKVDKEAEKMLWKAKVSGKRLTNAEAVRCLARSHAKVNYRSAWSVVRRARRRVNRKYAFVSKTASRLNLSEDLVTRWVRHGLLSSENCVAVVRILQDYSQELLER